MTAVYHFLSLVVPIAKKLHSLHHPGLSQSSRAFTKKAHSLSRHSKTRYVQEMLAQVPEVIS